MIHAPAALGTEAGGGVVVLHRSNHQRWELEPDQPSAAPLRTQAATRSPPGCEWLALQSSRGPRAARPARECALPRVRVSGGGEEARVLERAGFWNSPPRPAGTRSSPTGCGRPWRGRPPRARAPHATAPGSSPAPRGQVRRGGRGLRLPGPLPTGRLRWPARQAAPARPRPAPLRNSTQVGSRARTATLAPSARRRRRRSSGEPRQARRRQHGRARTAGGARAGSSGRRSRRRTHGGAGALPGKVKLEPEAARGRGGPKERRPAPRRAEP